MSSESSESPLWRRAPGLFRRLGPAGPLACAATLLPALGTFALYGRLSVIAFWLRDHSLAGPALCAVCFGLAGGMALVPTYAMSALCGWSFGFPIGLATTLTGFLAAALLGHTLARAFDRGRVMLLVDRSPKSRAVHRALTMGSFSKMVIVVSLIRLAPAAPFSLTNVVMAAARVPLLPYAIGTACGMVPRTALLVFAASRLIDPDAQSAVDLPTLAFGAVGTLAAAAALGWLGKQGLAHVIADGASPGEVGGTLGK